MPPPNQSAQTLRTIPAQKLAPLLDWPPPCTRPFRWSLRCHAGQAIVQIARHHINGQEYAIKFFLSRSVYAAEAALYQHTSPLSPFLPQLRGLEDNANGTMADAHGDALPPCIIMEKGESLDIFCQRRKPDRGQAYSVRPCSHPCVTRT